MRLSTLIWIIIVAAFIALVGWGAYAWYDEYTRYDAKKYEKIYDGYSEEELLELVRTNPENLEALTQLGRYYTAKGEKDPDNDDRYWSMAFDYLKKAAEKGHVVAKYNIGVAYVNGWGVEKDEKEAFNWWLRAAKHGYPSAQCAIGKCYFNGWCVEKDDEEAFRWFMKAAEQNDLDGMLGVAYSYFTGSGVKHDDEEGLIWAKKSADMGDDTALLYYKSQLKEDSVRNTSPTPNAPADTKDPELESPSGPRR